MTHAVLFRLVPLGSGLVMRCFPHASDLVSVVAVVAIAAIAALFVTRTSGQEMPNPVAAWERDSPPPEPKRTVLSPSCQWPIAKETPPKGVALGAFL